MEYSINKILFPFKFSATSLNAVNTAIKMCKRHNATLQLLHITPLEHVFPTAGMQAPPLALDQEIKKSDKINIENFVASIEREHHINCAVQYVSSGYIPGAICKYALESGADMIVIGIHPKARPANFLSESIAYRVLRQASCPVLTVPRQKETHSFQKIVFPVRPVLNALDKYRFIKGIIGKNNASVHIIGALKNTQRLQIDNTRRLVNRIKTTLEEENIPLSYELQLHPNIAGRILDTTRKLSADLIVITGSAKRNLRQYFLGSYAKKMINIPYAAVLCIKSPGVKQIKSAFQGNRTAVQSLL